MAVGWSASEQLASDGSVESVQTTALVEAASPMTIEGLLEFGSAYWTAVERSSKGVVRVRCDAGQVRVCLFGLVALLRFGPARTTLVDGAASISYPILGGLLAACPDGTLSISVHSEPSHEIELAVRGYYPRLGGRSLGRPGRFLYVHAQRRAHLATSRRFFHDVAESRS